MSISHGESKTELNVGPKHAQHTAPDQKSSAPQKTHSEDALLEPKDALLEPSLNTQAEPRLPQINFTVAAANMVQELISEEQNPALMLRVSIQGGGCSGFQYGFDLTDKQQADDHVTTQTIPWPPQAQADGLKAKTDKNPATDTKGRQSDGLAAGTDDLADYPTQAVPETIPGRPTADPAASEAKKVNSTQAHQQTATVTLLIDPLSLNYLAGASIDYREDIHGAQFVISNPNAKTTCGCGSSFSA